MQITTRERKILYIAAIVGIIFMATTAFPAIHSEYQERQGLIEEVLLNIDREKQLIENTITWRERRVEVEQRTQELEQQIFSGGTIPLVEADIQADLSQSVSYKHLTLPTICSV